jgi:hypothetical protein
MHTYIQKQWKGFTVARLKERLQQRMSMLKAVQQRLDNFFSPHCLHACTPVWMLRQTREFFLQAYQIIFKRLDRPMKAVAMVEREVLGTACSQVVVYH